MRDGKQALSSMTPMQIQAMSALGQAPAILSPMLRMSGFVRPPYNVVISNVPGSRTTHYMNGAQLLGIYPLSIPINGMALNITCTSYDDKMCFGLTGCRRTVPAPPATARLPRRRAEDPGEGRRTLMSHPDCHIRMGAGVSMSKPHPTWGTTGGDMSGNTRVPSAEITGLSGALIKRVVKKMVGEVPEPLGVMWHNQPVLKSTMALGRKAQKWDACDEDLKSYAHMAVASLIGCTWCLDYGYFEARNKGLDLDKAREIPRWRESEVFTPLERDVLEYAEAMCQTPPTVTDELSATLLDALGPAGLVELTAFVAFSNFSTRANVALGIESQGFAASCGLAPLATPSSRPGVVASR